MLIAVLATDEQWNELEESCDKNSVKRINALKDDMTADAYLILEESAIPLLQAIEKPVLVNSVIKTLTDLGTTENVLRINGWAGFLQRKIWEVAGKVTIEIEQVFTALGKQPIEVIDEPGLVAARVISMIVNEAYFAFEQEVSTKAEIDTAMKLGTNYPFGPFEWADKIGVQKIYNLLTRLSSTGNRYSPATILVKEATV